MCYLLVDVMKKYTKNKGRKQMNFNNYKDFEDFCKKTGMSTKEGLDFLIEKYEELTKKEGF